MTGPPLADIECIHQASMAILKKTGLRLHLPEAVELFARRGQKVEGDRVFPTEEFLLAELAKAPPVFTLHAGNKEHDLELGSENRYYAAGYGCPNIIGADGRPRVAVMDDFLRLAKMVQASPAFKINGGILAQPSDVPPSQAARAMVYATLLHSDKCVLGIPGHRREIEEIMGLVALARDMGEEFRSSPQVITLVNTLAPLQIDRLALESIFVTAEQGQALVVSPGPMAGSTGPVTLAGNIAQGNAEGLVGLALAQMIQPETPVVYGLMATTSDLRTGGVSIGAPGCFVQARYAKALADYYHLPCRSGGGLTDARAVSVQSGFEAALSLFAAAQTGIHLVIHAAGILDSFMAMSFEKFIYDLDLISSVDFFLRDLPVDEESLAVEVINEVGPGGSFLIHPHTVKLCRRVLGRPRAVSQGPAFDRTSDPAEQLLGKAARARTTLMDTYEPPRLSGTIVKRMDSYLSGRGFSQAFLDRLKP